MTPRDFISDLMPWSGTLLLVYAVIFERESLRRLVTPHTAGGYASVDFYLCWLVSGVAAYLGKYFSKVLSLVTLLRKCTWAMTFENSLYMVGLGNRCILGQVFLFIKSLIKSLERALLEKAFFISIFHKHFS
jgi:hypothetical protein